MRAFNVLAFDESIKGTTASWYTPDSLNTQFGGMHILILQACTTLVSGTNPKLTVSIEHSSDAQEWVAWGSAQLSAVTIANNGSYLGAGVLFGWCANVRFRITLTGTNPECRLKLYVTGRQPGVVAEQGAVM